MTLQKAMERVAECERDEQQVLLAKLPLSEAYTQLARAKERTVNALIVAADFAREQGR